MGMNMGYGYNGFLFEDYLGAVAAALPFLTGVVIWSIFYFRYDVKVLKAVSKGLGKIIQMADILPKGDINNLALLNESLACVSEEKGVEGIPSVDKANGIDYLFTDEFRTAWERLMYLSEVVYTEEILPEGRAFFDKEYLLMVPSRRDSVKYIWGVITGLVIFSLGVTPLIIAILGSQNAILGVAGGLIAAGLLIIVHLIFVAFDLKAFRMAEMEYHRFLMSFDLALPTASTLSEAALLLDATKKNQKVFENVAISISQSFEKETTKINDAICDFAEAVNHRQETGMKELSESFSAKLVHGFESRINSIGAAMEEYQKKMESTCLLQQKALEEYSSRFEKIFDEQRCSSRDLMEGYLRKIEDLNVQYQRRIEEQETQYLNRMEEREEVYKNGKEKQNKEHQEKIQKLNEEYLRITEERNADYQNRLMQLNGLLGDSLTGMSEIMEGQSGAMHRAEGLLSRLEASQKETMEFSLKLNKNLNDIADLTNMMQKQTERFSVDMKAVMEKGIHAQQSLASLVEGITGEMQKAMQEAGKEIAEGVNSGVAGNAKAIEALTEQAQNLRQDYEMFFSRSEESSQKTLDEMDYQVQGVIMRISEEIGTMLETSITRNGEILSQYKDQTADILASFDEQARSMSLYAKEINMDIAGLSENLGTAIGDFNDKMREGLSLAISEFDSGLSELTHRIANTVESIVDAVETLPEKIRI
ncbi:MAG: hypothetical protein ACOX4U_03880 [Anaerovoracaceae bacterium]|jgi:hypothetical protein